MSTLLINVGNTHTVAARRDGDLRELWGGVSTPDAAAAIAGCAREGEAVAIASVVPAVTAALLAALPAARAVDHTWTLPFAHELREPQTVGADRWCNVAAACAVGLRDALVIDAGTATTFDILQDGIFRGGLIAPGMALAARALQERAARLWPVPFAACPLEAGRDTASALAAGGYHVGVHGVVGTARALLERYPGLTVVTTGGLAEHVRQPGWRHDPLWTLRGLEALATAAA